MLPCFTDECPCKTIFWVYGINLSSVPQETWMNMQRLLCVSDECPFQDPSSEPMVLTPWALSPRRPKWICRGYPVSLMNALYKNTFQVSLSYQLDEALSPGRPEQGMWRADTALVSLRNGFSRASCPKTIKLTLKLSLRPKWGSPMSLMNSLFNTIFPLKLSYQLEALPTRRMS